MRIFSILAVVILLCIMPAHAQSDQAGGPVLPDRNYQLLREDEDWSFLRDPALRQDFWDPIKYIPLRHNSRDWYLTISGEAREVWEQTGELNPAYALAALVALRQARDELHIELPELHFFRQVGGPPLGGFAYAGKAWVTVGMDDAALVNIVRHEAAHCTASLAELPHPAVEAFAAGRPEALAAVRAVRLARGARFFEAAAAAFAPAEPVLGILASSD